MKRKKTIPAKKMAKAISLGLAGALASEPFIEAADNPHVEPPQHEEEPRLALDSPFTATTGAIFSLEWIDSDLESVSGPPFQVVKKL